MRADGASLKLAASPDHAVAPITGWTRRHWEEAGRTLLRNALGEAEPGASSLPFPTPHRKPFDSDRIESFARTAILAGPLLAAGALPEPEWGRTLRFFRDGLLAGTDPGHSGYWGPVTNSSQRLVELPSLAWFLYLTRPLLWDDLPDPDKKQIAAYLAECNAVSTHRNNWMAFDVVTNAVLKRLDMPYSETRMRERRLACDDLYVGGGWYRDGQTGNQFDLYNFWGFHRYLLQWVILDGDSDPEWAEVCLHRADRAISDLRHFVAADGTIPCFGRSMTYRFAALGPIPLRLLRGFGGVEAGALRTLMSLVTKRFCDAPILTSSGHLSLGYLRPCRAMLERYSCGGSPYWACAAFDLLLLDADHPIWRAPEAPLPIHESSFAVALDDPGVLLLGDHQSGHVQIVNQKSFHYDTAYNPKYTNFVYSSAFPYEPRAADGQLNSGNALEWSADGKGYRQRYRMKPLHLSSRLSISRSHLYGLEHGGEVTTCVLAKGDVLVNVHRVELQEPAWFREGGYPLGFDEGEPGVERTGAAATVHLDGRTSYLRALHGWPAPPRLQWIRGSDTDPADAGPLHRHTVTPVLQTARVGPGVVHFVSLMYGGSAGRGSLELDGRVTDVAVRAGVVSVTFRDGERVMLRLGRIPRLVSRSRGPRGTEMAIRITPDGRRETLAASRVRARSVARGILWAIQRWRG